ncbi:DUF454 domain-containing protein [Romboutsia ilealis]|uniref:YbaN family protein n=1 Tax=Romboutsia faecis TaxID=2764597 RepID=A0ABR7JL69_9FIRM|nr:YbaN family protein [Romboutsia faecis]MBC5995570.1 YbaN family protein [Romboutsia faecis]MRN23772.1 DUF454 domain-containing protein [Romboutsia ilealis]
MTNIKKFFYIFIGLIAFLLGAIGVVLPVLPTTPFLLVASFCFVRGSEKFDKWFKGTRIYKKHLENFVESRAMTLKQKVSLVLFADFMMLIPFIMVDNIYMRITLIVVSLTKLYYFTFKVKTIKSNSAIN